MSESKVGACHRSKQGRRKRLRVLLGGLALLLGAYGLSGINWKPLLEEWGFGPALEQCVTKEKVLKYLDGQTVFRLPPANTSGGTLEMMTLRKKGISWLRLRSAPESMVLFRFRYRDGSRQYDVDGSFWNTSMEFAHQHSWDSFEAKAVPRS